MQLSEAMIWMGIDKGDEKLNARGTSFGKYLLTVHNFALGIGIVLSVIFISKRHLQWTDFVPALLGLLFTVIIIVTQYLPKKYPGVSFPQHVACAKEPRCQTPENRLRWPYPHGWYIFSFALSLVIMFFWIKPVKSKILFGLVFGLSFLVAGLIYPKTVGSVWCWSTSFIAPLIVLSNYFLIRQDASAGLVT